MRCTRHHRANSLRRLRLLEAALYADLHGTAIMANIIYCAINLLQLEVEFLCWVWVWAMVHFLVSCGRLYLFFFIKKIMEDISPFSRVTVTCVLDLWWCLQTSLRFSSGATPASLLAASMAAKLIASMYLRAGIGGARNRDLSCWRRMLYRLSYAGSAQIVFVYIYSFLEGHLATADM